RTDVRVETELNVTGKPAQFGRGTLAEVSGALMARFAENLAAELAANSPRSEPGSPRSAVSDPLDLIDASGAGALKRIAPPTLAAALLLLIGLVLRRRRGAGVRRPGSAGRSV